MPIGSYVVLPHVAHALETSRPQRVLDLGAGFGIYGAVVREWLDGGVKPWRTLLVGVEGHAPYGNPLWDLYDVMAIDTIERFMDRHAERYDAVLMLDVIEHFEKVEGGRRLEQAQQRVAPGGQLLVSTPAVFVPQGSVHGNPLEQHRSLWTAEEFTQRGFRLLCDGQLDPLGGQMIVAQWCS